MTTTPSSRARRLGFAAALLFAALIFALLWRQPPANPAPTTTQSAPVPVSTPEGKSVETTTAKPTISPLLKAKPLHEAEADRPALVSAATVKRSGKSDQPIEPAIDRRILVDPVETVKVVTAITAREGEVRVVAPNGGTFNERRGPLLKDAAKLDGKLEFAFTTGGTRGRYTVEISSGNDTQTLEFWVGKESPQGEPGPALVFAGQ